MTASTVEVRVWLLVRKGIVAHRRACEKMDP